MIVVLPVCEKDEHLALLNLEICSKLDGKEPFDCLIVHDVSFNNQKVLDAASKVFKYVNDISVPCPNPNSKWPVAANLMWQTTARYMSLQNHSWLWWEPDAVLLKKNGLKIIESEYEKGKKPFMGAWTYQGRYQYMAGVGVYPASVSFYNESCFFCTNQPFDVELGRSISGSCHRVNELIHHELDPRNNLTEGQCKILASEGSVLFHKCKDGSLHNFVLSNNSFWNWVKTEVLNINPTITVSQSPITVVITNFKRPDRVKNAFNSCINAGVGNIVVSSSGCDSELSKVHNTFKKQNRNVIIESIEDDRGCNEMWLRGVKKVMTPWVHILHDDDSLNPDFLSVEKILDAKPGFVHWSAIQKDDNGQILNTLSSCPNQSEGMYDSKQLIPIMFKYGGLSVTPVNGLFHTIDIDKILTECESLCSGEFNYRPNMMIGNDLLIWLRSIEKYEKYYWIPRALTSLGYWNGSTTVNSCYDLTPFYDKMRDYFWSHPLLDVKVPKPIKPIFPNTRIIHCVERHTGSKEEEERKITAFKSWEYIYQHKGVIPAHYKDYERDSACIGETRKLPFLKDVLSYGISLANPNDIILFTNDDTIIHPRLPDLLRRVMSNRGATMSHRCEYKGINFDEVLNVRMFKEGTKHWGRDLFAFTIPWLRDHWDRIPDYVMGAPFWDLILTVLIRNEINSDICGSSIDELGHSWEHEIPVGYVAHIEHDHQWNGQRPADKYNETLAKHSSTILCPTKLFCEVVRL